MKKEATSKSSLSYRVAFTLIELLVVIAIIGILSGLIIVSLGGMTQKATIAKAQVFSNSLRNSLLMNIAGEWKLDEGSGTAANDTWTRTNNGTLYNFANTTAGYGDTHADGWMSSSNCISGPCLKFDGVDDYINCGNGVSLNIVSTITLEAWVNPTSLIQNDPEIIDKGGAADDYRMRFLSGGYIGARFYGTNISDTNSISTLKAGVFTHVVVVYNGSANLIYFNGVLDKSQANSGNITANNSWLSLGSNSGFSEFFNGLIDEVHVYSAAMPTSQIKEQYYAGLNKLLANGVISKEDYLLRVSEIASK